MKQHSNKKLLLKGENEWGKCRRNRFKAGNRAKKEGKMRK
jgi:hypothetical protein